MSTPEKELQHCSICGQMTNHLEGNCLKHSTPEIERVLHALEYVISHPEEGSGDTVNDVRKVIVNFLTTHDADLWEKIEGMKKTCDDSCLIMDDGSHRHCDCGKDFRNETLSDVQALLTPKNIIK